MYAGGGAGGPSSYAYSGNYSPNSVSFGGGGGGGNGGSAAVGTYFLYSAKPGQANTGGGAGAPGASNSASYPTYGQPGGSGIVIIRYPANYSAPTAFGGSYVPRVLYNNGYQVYIWTNSGTVTF
jgi:hypothetical protein